MRGYEAEEGNNPEREEDKDPRDQERAQPEAGEGEGAETETEEGENRDGQVYLRDGQVVVEPPRGQGQAARVVASSGVELVVNGVPVDELLARDPEDRIEVAPREDPGRREVQVQVSPDRLAALIRILYDPGVRHILPRDTEPAPQLNLVGEKEPVQPPLTEEELVQELTAAGVVYGVDHEALGQALAREGDDPVVAARGDPPGDSSDGWVELLFSTEERVVLASADDKEKVDHRNRVYIPSVKAGEVVAIKHAPQTGSPGRAVTGETLEARVPRDTEIVAGSGVELSEDGKMALATAAGRPVVEGKGRVRILPVLSQRGDVDVSTGNIRFDGDVEIFGSVAEGMKVEAGGSVVVRGHVNHARVEAGRGVVVEGNVVGGQVRAGGPGALYDRVLDLLRHLEEDLEQLDQGLEQLIQVVEAKAGVAPERHGPLVQTLVEHKLKDLPRRIQELCELFRGEEDIDEEWKQVAKGMQQAFWGLKVQELSRCDVVEMRTRGAEWREELEAREAEAADVAVRYAQNARIEATGDIDVQGQGCYHSQLVAAGKVTVLGNPGFVRGGATQARVKVEVNQAGSPGGTPTVVATTADGFIEIQTAHPSVVVQAGEKKTRFDRETHGVNARLVKGELVLF